MLEKVEKYDDKNIRNAPKKQSCSFLDMFMFKRGWSQTHVVSERLLDFQSKWPRADFDHDDDLDKDTKMIMKSIAVN